MRKKILITGSEGLLGGLVKKTLQGQHTLILLDKKLNTDLLNKIEADFSGVDTAIHLAANSKPWISSEEARENIDMTYNVLEAVRKNDAKRVVFSSSLYVYNFAGIFFEGGRITTKTPRSFIDPRERKAPKFFYYKLSKIISENLIKAYHDRFGISGLNLRIGSVSKDNKPLPNPWGNATWLSYEDFKEIIKRAINYEGFANVPCVSNNSEKFVDLSDLKKEIGYTPKSDSSNLS